jgi:aminoglycoside phosphotransferase (APT) family kinase protein
LAAGTVSDTATLARRLGDFLAAASGDRPVVTVGERISGGWSVNTFRLCVDGRDCVLRFAGHDHPLRTDAAEEARMMIRAGEAGIPVPPVLYAADDPSWLGVPFAILDFVSGGAPNVWSPRRMAELLRVASAEELLEQLVAVSIAVQDVPLTPGMPTASLLGVPLPEYGIAADVDRWLGLLEASGDPRPALVSAGRWLRENAPRGGAVVLQHHDFRLGNLMFDAAGQIAAVLDWEFSGPGDPLCDIGYAAQPYCLGRLLGTESSFDLEPDPTSWVLRRYGELAPEPVEEERLRYFVAFGILKMAIALIVPSQPSAERGRPPHHDWLELPVLSLTDDLVAAIRGMG